VLDELADIPVCVGYKVNGRHTDEIPADACGWDKIECLYKKMPAWKSSTRGITEFKKLPKTARDYLSFIEKETGARVGMVSTGPGREETIFVDEFLDELDAMSKDNSRPAKVASK
jgi:adenylosuccinate synthase